MIRVFTKRTISVWATVATLCAAPVCAESALTGTWKLSSAPEAFEELLGKAEMDFRDGDRFAIRAGCNTHLGSYSETEGAFDFSLTASTMMACPDDVVARSWSFIDQVARHSHFVRTGNALELMSGEGDVIFTFESTPD